MLLFSYMISAALEIAITYLQYQITGEIPWIYALLAGSSLLSIAIEFSVQGEAARDILRKAGKNVDVYDMSHRDLFCGFVRCRSSGFWCIDGMRLYCGSNGAGSVTDIKNHSAAAGSTMWCLLRIAVQNDSSVCNNDSCRLFI